MAPLNVEHRPQLSAAPVRTPPWRGDRAPVPPASGDTGDREDFALLYAAIDAVMRRCPPRIASRQFPAAAKAHAALRVQFARPGMPKLPAQVICDLSHEIAQYVEFPVRQAVLRCMRKASMHRH